MGPAYDLNRMILAAASLRERVAGGVYQGSTTTDESLAESRLAAWREKSAQGSGGKFERRLSWENLDVVAARRVLGSDPVQLEPAPVWTALMGDMLAFLARPGGPPALAFGEEIVASKP